MDKTGPPSPSHSGLGASLRRETRDEIRADRTCSNLGDRSAGLGGSIGAPRGGVNDFFRGPRPVVRCGTGARVPGAPGGPPRSAQRRSLRLVRHELDRLREGFPAPIVVLVGQRLARTPPRRVPRTGRSRQPFPASTRTGRTPHPRRTAQWPPAPSPPKLAQRGQVRDLARLDPAGDSLPERSAAATGPMQHQEVRASPPAGGRATRRLRSRGARASPRCASGSPSCGRL